MEAYAEQVPALGQGESVDALEDAVRYDPDGALSAARSWLVRARQEGDDSTARRLELVCADVDCRRGGVQSAAHTIRQVLEWALEHDDRYLIARSHRQLARVFLRLGDNALNLEHAVPAVEHLDRHWRPSLRADHLLALATALSACGSFGESWRRFEEANTLAAQADDVHLRRVVLNNLAFTQFKAGDGEAAVAVAERLHAVVTAAGFELGYEELDTIASSYRIGGRLEEAEQLLLPVLDGGGADLATSDFDGGAACLLTLAQVQRSLGKLEAAQQTLDKCRSLCEGKPTSVRILAQREHAELSAARGDYRAAYETFFEFFEEHQRLESAEREARARSLQAIFETTEARRDSERFRELSERDALTGLRNRRFVEAHLDSILLDVTDGGGPVSVALMDLDRFKRINDTRSHAVGDDVLRRVAHVLAYSAHEVAGGVAARMGGEEFLLILPGLDLPAALDHLEQTRLRIQHRGWSDLTAGLPVTVSVGVACAPEDATDRGDLLHCADVRLYAAKGAGRNQVMGTPTP